MSTSRRCSSRATAADWPGPRISPAHGSRLSADSAHAAILPLYYLRRARIDEAHLQITRFDTDIGKHGDTGRSELDAVEAVLAGEADVAAIGSSTWAAMGAEELVRDLLA
jgi:ABC-type phosphate/phosphonate transport system substrate-binding protein